VVERHAARQTIVPKVLETVAQRGRLAESVSNPNSCLGDQPVSARKGRSSRQITSTESGSVNQLRPTIGIDVSQAQLDVAVHPTGEQWHATNDETGFGPLIDRLRVLHNRIQADGPFIATTARFLIEARKRSSG